MLLMETADGLVLTITHKPEAENDFVQVHIADCADAPVTSTFLQPHEAIQLATALLNHAALANAANKGYLAGDAKC